MNVLILGATGMLGHVMTQTLSGNHKVIAVSRTSLSPKIKVDILRNDGIWVEGLDIQHFEALEALFDRAHPQVVLNCVGIVKQRNEVNDAVLSIEVNSLFPHRLARLCDQHRATLIHFSTDCVFSGKHGNYQEYDTPDPVDFYGRSKLLGEIDRPPHLTIRTSIIGFELEHNTGLIEWFLRQEGKEVKGFNQAIYSGLTTYKLSDIVNTLLSKQTVISGLYQIASSPITKFRLLTKVNELLKLNIRIFPDEKFLCDRSLDGTRFTNDTRISVPTWDQMLTDLVVRRHIYDRWKSTQHYIV